MALFDADVTLPLLTEAEDWLFSDEAESATDPAVAEALFAELAAKVLAASPK